MHRTAQRAEPPLYNNYEWSMCACACSVTQSCPTPGSSVHGISQARILGWFAISSSRGSPDPGIEPTSHVAPALQVDSLLLSHLGSP